MDALKAIRHRRTVRTYTDRPVADEDLDRLLRLALLAPTGGMAQAWGLVVVREPERRERMARLVIDGGAEYFRIARPPAEGNGPEEHAAWAREYAETVLATYTKVPVWIIGLIVPRHMYPEEWRTWERDADLESLSFAMENLFVAARAKGLGTAPTSFHLFNEPAIREFLGLPEEVEPALVTPLGYPEEFPEGLPPALAKRRRPWRSLVHDERWGATRA